MVQNKHGREIFYFDGHVVRKGNKYGAILLRYDENYGRVYDKDGFEVLFLIKSNKIIANQGQKSGHQVMEFSNNFWQTNSLHYNRIWRIEGDKIYGVGSNHYHSLYYCADGFKLWQAACMLYLLHYF